MMTTTAPGSQQLPRVSTRPRSPHGAPTIAAVLKTAATRCFTVTELIDLLSADTTPLKISTSAPASPPPSGSIFLYDRLITRNCKKDGHNWIRKRVSSKNTRWKVREDNVKLHLNRVPRIAGCYARSADVATLRRRSYHLIGPVGSRPLNSLVLIHYIHDVVPVEDGKMSFLEAPVPNASSGPAVDTRYGGKRKISVVLDSTGANDQQGESTGNISATSSPLNASSRLGVTAVGSCSAEEVSDDGASRGRENGPDAKSASSIGTELTNRLGTGGTSGGERSHGRRPDFSLYDGKNLLLSQPTDVTPFARGSFHSEDDVQALSSPRSATAMLGVDAGDFFSGKVQSGDWMRNCQKKYDGMHPGIWDGSILASHPGASATAEGERSFGRRPHFACSDGKDLLQSQRTDITCNGRGSRRSEDDTPTVLPLTHLLSRLAIIQAAPRTTEEQTVQEWLSFTERERNRAISDIYGSAVLRSVPNTNSNVDCINRFTNEIDKEAESLKLALIDEEVMKLPPAEKLAYLEALYRCPQLVSAKDAKLLFLLCEDGCPQAAARRLVRYWAQKVEILGFASAFSRLSLEGVTALNCDDPTSWYCRLLPGTDASGRGVIFVDSTKRGNFMGELQSIWYMIHAALEDDSVKRNGIVIIVHRTPAVQTWNRDEMLRKLCLIRDILPIKLCAIHKCHLQLNISWLAQVFHEGAHYAFGRHMRCRMVQHEGSIEEVLCQLAEYGISRSQLPTQIGGRWTDEDFRQWLAQRKASGR